MGCTHWDAHIGIPCFANSAHVSACKEGAGKAKEEEARKKTMRDAEAEGEARQVDNRSEVETHVLRGFSKTICTAIALDLRSVKTLSLGFPSVRKSQA